MKYFVAIRLAGDFPVFEGRAAILIEATDEIDIYDQATKITDSYYEAISYTEVTNMTNLDLVKAQKGLEDRMVNCSHNKVYANKEFETYPAQSPWICSLCGKEGSDFIGVGNYFELKRKFRK